MMSIIDKLKKIKHSQQTKNSALDLPKDEGIGVLNGLLLLSAAVGTLISIQHAADAAGTTCTDTINQKVTDTGNTATAFNSNQAVQQSWGNHCWWNWWAHHAFGAGGS